MELPSTQAESQSLPVSGQPIQVTLTPKAIEKAKTFAQGNQEAEGKGNLPKHFRIYVQGGGCSGFSYGFNFDETREGDAVIEAGDIKVLIDPGSAQYLNNCVVDYVESFQGAGFSVQNPNAKGSCGCGSSFTV